MRILGESANECTVVPAWMFDARCDRMQIEAAPRVALETLVDLKELLAAVTKKLDLPISSMEFGSDGTSEPPHTQTTDRSPAPASADASAMDGAAGAVPRGDDSPPRADARAALPLRSARGRGGAR